MELAERIPDEAKFNASVAECDECGGRFEFGLLGDSSATSGLSDCPNCGARADKWKKIGYNTEGGFKTREEVWGDSAQEGDDG
jgi:hypothetical protein